MEKCFLGFSECVNGVTCKAIADNLLKYLSEWQHDANKLCGQSYGGAGAMASKSRGASTRITQLHPKAIYTHCSADMLNLCVVQCCSIPEVRNIMSIADRVCRF